MKHRKNERGEEGNRREEREGRGGGRERKKERGRGREFLPRIGPRVLRSSMQVLIKRIQKRGDGSLCVEMWERVTWVGGGLTSAPAPHPPPPCPAAFLPCFHLFFLPLSRRAAPVHLDIGRSRRVKVRKRIEWHSTHSPLRRPHSPRVPSPQPPEPEPAQRPLTGGEVIDFISTLMRLLVPKPVIVTSGRKGFTGILSRADAKIPTSGRQPVGEKSSAGRTQSRTSTSSDRGVWKLCRS